MLTKLNSKKLSLLKENEISNLSRIVGGQRYNTRNNTGNGKGSGDLLDSNSNCGSGSGTDGKGNTVDLSGDLYFGNDYGNTDFVINSWNFG
jgi:hypothetical protein